MALVNRTKKEVNAKLVFFGPALAGKRTNLEYIYKKLKPECRGKLKSVATQNDRMLFFDFMPAELADVNGYSFRFHIYTISGDVSQPAIWKMVLKGVDGIVFVADSAQDRMLANIDSMKTLVEHLSSYGKGFQDVPCVVQCNKQDATGALPIQEINRMLSVSGLPLVPAKAKKGEGVITTLNKLIKVVLQKLKETEPAVRGEGETAKKKASVESETPTTKAVATAAAVTPLKGDSFDELASFTLAQAAEAGNVFETQSKAPESTSGDEPVIELLGEMEMIEDGRFRLPLSVSCCGKKKRFAITISLAVEDLLR